MKRDKNTVILKERGRRAPRCKAPMQIREHKEITDKELSRRACYYRSLVLL